jgi:hypothetical protein
MKNHFRKVLKSDHLGCADLEDMLEAGQSLIFTIKEVRQQYGVSVAGKKGDFNIAYFAEKIKPLVLNSTNAKVIKSFAGGSPFVEDWNNIRVELFIDENVKMKGEVVGGVRIKPVQPKTVQKPTFTEANFEKAAAAGATLETIAKHYDLSDAMAEKYMNYLTPNI